MIQLERECIQDSGTLRLPQTERARYQADVEDEEFHQRVEGSNSFLEQIEEIDDQEQIFRALNSNN